MEVAEGDVTIELAIMESLETATQYFSDLQIAIIQSHPEDDVKSSSARNWLALDILSESTLTKVASFILWSVGDLKCLRSEEGKWVLRTALKDLNVTITSISTKLDSLLNHYDSLCLNLLLDRQNLEAIQDFMLKDEVSDLESLERLVQMLGESNRQEVLDSEKALASAGEQHREAIRVKETTDRNGIIQCLIPALIGLPLAMATGGLSMIVTTGLTALQTFHSMEAAKEVNDKAEALVNDSRTEVAVKERTLAAAAAELRLDEGRRLQVEQKQAWLNFNVDQFLDYAQDQRELRRSLAETEKAVKQHAASFAGVYGAMEELESVAAHLLEELESVAAHLLDTRNEGRRRQLEANYNAAVVELGRRFHEFAKSSMEEGEEVFWGQMLWLEQLKVAMDESDERKLLLLLLEEDGKNEPTVFN